jgi:nucleoside-diphosphate-sugar epimerase
MFILKKNKRVKIIKLRKRSKISEVNRLISDNSLLKTYTDWTPKYEIDDGIKKTIKWVKNNKFLYNSKNYNI